MNYLDQEKERITQSLADTGFARSHVYHLLTDEELQWFEKCQEYYHDFSTHPEIVKRLDILEKGYHKGDRGKRNELTHQDFLPGPIGLESGAFLQLYSAGIFLDIAGNYLDAEPVMRNIATWIHGYTPAAAWRFRSQWWHRDTEDASLLKIWIYYSPVTPENGALEYVQNSRWGDKHNHLWPNYNPHTDSWSTHGYLDEETAEQIPSEDIVMATGEVGTVIFADTNGFHRGGLVTEPGFRLKTQCCYLRPDAYQIRHGPLTGFNWDPARVNLCDKNHPLYGTLSERAKKALE